MRETKKIRILSGFPVSVWRILRATRHAAWREGGHQKRDGGGRYRGRGRRVRGCLPPPAAPPFFAAPGHVSIEARAVAAPRCGLCEKNCPLSAPGCPKGAALQAQQRR